MYRLPAIRPEKHKQVDAIPTNEGEDARIISWPIHPPNAAQNAGKNSPQQLNTSTRAQQGAKTDYEVVAKGATTQAIVEGVGLTTLRRRANETGAGDSGIPKMCVL